MSTPTKDSAVIADNMVVLFHYKLTNNDGEVLDASDDDEPMAYLHGADNIVPGLERAMLNRKVGDKFDVKVAPEEGYGERIDGDTVVPRDQFPPDAEFEEGMSVVAEGPDGETFPLWIKSIDTDTITLDPNHPFAGVELNFSVEITEVRAASEEEIEHGHPHGPDGHHHH
jgi:FKBP-type peptidyl-prolyl cis-trans isomerase SlyD